MPLKEKPKVLLEIDWEEFWQVVKGHGPCNKERMKARVGAWKEGEWVRDAAMAYADKQANKNLYILFLYGTSILP